MILLGQPAATFTESTPRQVEWLLGEVPRYRRSASSGGKRERPGRLAELAAMIGGRRR